MSSVDTAEVEKFAAMAQEWWDPQGTAKPLHMLNPCRLDYITRQIAAEFGRDLTASQPFDGLRIADIGCGGGLICEPLARLGATVTGIDAAAENIAVARLHAEGQGLQIDYRATTAEALASDGEDFDAVLALEIIEHVAEPGAFLTSCAALLAHGGVFLTSTLNRTSKSFALGIVGAEWVMGWLPKGTHDWRRFVTPDEMKRMLENAGIACVDRTGMVFDPLRWRWSLNPRDLSVNYIVTGTKSGPTG